jgi:hypothetical protein
MVFLLDLACYTKASGQKSEGQGVAFGGFPSEFFDFFGEFLVGYQFPLYLYLTYEVFQLVGNR